jgi:hypothetical protein
MAQKCPNCGANLVGSADHRSTACPYCGADAPVALDAAALAQSLGHDFKSVEAMFEHLAAKLAREFPKITKVESSGGWFTSGSPTGFEVTLGTEVLAMKHDGSHIVATRKKVVRGIALKTEVLAIADWVEALADGIAAMADESAAARAALERLSGRK